MFSISLKLTIAFYLFLVSVVLYIKPQFIFDDEGNLKSFGTGVRKSILPLWLVFFLFAVVSYNSILSLGIN